MKLEHVAFNVEEPATMAQWYAENLNMHVVLAHDEPPFIHFLAPQDGLVMIEVYHNPAADVPNYRAMDPFVLHIAFAVQDIEGARDRLLAAGATSEGEIFDMGTGQLLFLRDPWGVPIQLVQRQHPLI